MNSKMTGKLQLTEMASCWSSDHVVADHRDLQANTMALDFTGQFVALAGRRYVAIVHLDKPGVPVKKVLRNSKWEVCAAEWNPHNRELLALACNQRAELLCWREDLSQQCILRSHTRAISDLNWSVFEPNVLATASLDNFVHLWDIREPKKPTISLSAVAGAVQVKWNKVVPNLLATSHEGDVRLWDPRKGTSPVQYIAAHLTKIHGLDWNPSLQHQLATSSQDCTVKFWDITSPRKAESVLSSGSPVWRARYAPFGNGLVTVMVPQLRRGENSLVLWNIASLSSPLHSFVGHSDVVMEFGWRKLKEGDNRGYQLVTWSKDQSLRIWNIDTHLQRLCGHESITESYDSDMVIIGTTGTADSQEITDSASQASQTSPQETETGWQSTPPNSPNKTRSKKKKEVPKIVQAHGTPVSPLSQPQNLEKEFSLVNLFIPNLTINEMDASRRICTVTAVSGKYQVVLNIIFPSSYPYNSSPEFHFSQESSVDSGIKEKLLNVLIMVSQQQVKRNRSCLEPCLRQLVNTLDNCAAIDKNDQDNGSPYHLDASKRNYISSPVYGNFQDVSVPFPRTSGARFCGADMLVCFMRPPHLQKINAPTEVTPRSLSALTAFLSSHILPIKGRPSPPSQYSLGYAPVAHSPTDPAVSISSFYYHSERKQKPRKKHGHDNRRSSGHHQQQPSNSGAVLIYSVSGVMLINRMLAENYEFNYHDVVAMCTKNASVAASAGRKDLVQIWSVAALQAGPNLQPNSDPDAGIPWTQHPFGRKMLQSIMNHYINLHDVQTVAMLSCAFTTRNTDHQKNKKTVTELGCTVSGSPGGSPYHTVVPTDALCEGWASVLKRNRSNSWSDSIEEYRLFDGFADSNDGERERHEVNCRMLDPKLTDQYDQYKKIYAEILHRWNLLEQRALVLKYVSTAPEKHKGVEFVTECQHCHQDVRGAQCVTCKRYNFCCIICHVAVKGCSSFCLSCGHGGHTYHMERWFMEMDVCAAGCGCKCLEESNIFGS